MTDNKEFYRGKVILFVVMQYLVKLSFVFLAVLISLALSVSLTLLWKHAHPVSHGEHLYVTWIAFFAFFSLCYSRKTKKISSDNLRKFFDMKFSQAKFSPYQTDIEEAAKEWNLNYKVFIKQWIAKVTKQFLISTTALIIPLSCLFLVSSITSEPISQSLNEFVDIIADQSYQADLRVVEGFLDQDAEKTWEINKQSMHDLKLTSPNLLELSWKGYSKEPPIVELRGTGSSTSFTRQTFQMIKEMEQHHFRLKFAVSENAQLFIPQISNSAPLANISVETLPIPKVKMSTRDNIDELWPDDKALRLHIEVEAENPLQVVSLLLRAGNRESRELVNTIHSQAVYQYSTEYSLVLESYINADMVDVELVAEAIDRSLPTPLIGYSQPIRLRTASAYGRYQRALQTLYKIKRMIDESLESNVDPDFTSFKEAFVSALKQSQETPFFDGLDRVQIAAMKHAGDEYLSQASMDKLATLSQSLNQFLEEHEILDDRERDRDFFVAARRLSRVIENRKDTHKDQVTDVASRISKYLERRRARWKLRVARLSTPLSLTKWSEVKAGRFEKDMEKIIQIHRKDLTPVTKIDKSLQKLSKTVSLYRQWIEELEEHEDNQREETEKSRQRGLMSAREQLQKIQRQQGAISSQLDRSVHQSQEQLESLWPVVRMNQNTNKKEAEKLENKLRSLSPAAAQRMKAAVNAMDKTLSMGADKKFIDAESYADFAGRLLRKAEKESRKQPRSSRQRRRRRVTGDKYYGQAIHGGDIEIDREYQVDSRFREDILREVYHPNQEAKDKALLENYLRRIVR